jgi:hypothetical protein
MKNKKQHSRLHMDRFITRVGIPLVNRWTEHRQVRRHMILPIWMASVCKKTYQPSFEPETEITGYVH